jgi:hypothetical protein
MNRPFQLGGTGPWMIAIQDPSGRTRYDSAPTEEAAWAKLERYEDEAIDRRRRGTHPVPMSPPPPPVRSAVRQHQPPAGPALRPPSPQGLRHLVRAVRIFGRVLTLRRF